jgi:AcrR family transcriptional regulator
MAPPPRASLILSAADDLFAERGYNGVSMRDVAERAGVKKALVFYHHQNKDSLFERVLDNYYAAHAEALRAAFEVQGPLRERFHHVIDRYLDFIDTHRSYAKLVQREVCGANPERVRRGLQPLLLWVERALVDVAPSTGPRSSKHLFVTISGAVINYFTYASVLSQGWGSDPLSEQGINERRAHLHWLVDCLLDGLEREDGG